MNASPPNAYRGDWTRAKPIPDPAPYTTHHPANFVTFRTALNHDWPARISTITHLRYKWELAWVVSVLHDCGTETLT